MSVRLPTELERAVFEDTVRYGAVYRGSRTFGRSVHEGWTPVIERELERQAMRYTNSSDVATVAHMAVERFMRTTTH